MATVPLLVTVIVAVKPLAHWLSIWKAAEQVAVPPLAGGVGVAVLTGVGVAVMTGVGVAVLIGVAVGEADGMMLPEDTRIRSPSRSGSEWLSCP